MLTFTLVGPSNTSTGTEQKKSINQIGRRKPRIAGFVFFLFLFFLLWLIRFRFYLIYRDNTICGVGH